MNLRSALILCWLSFLPFFAQSAHLSSYGSQITYEYVGDSTYAVKIYLYRDCGVTNWGNMDVYSQISNQKGTAFNLNLELVSIKTLDRYKRMKPNPCLTGNVSSAGNGIEQHVYVDTVDFKEAKYDSFKNVCDVRISFVIDRRSSVTTLNSSSTKLYNYAILNKCLGEGESSPQLMLEPVFYTMLNQPAHLHTGLIDTSRQDSISYEMVEPLTSISNSVIFNYSLSYQNPLTVYYPGTLKPPYRNPWAKPPIGYHVDELNGNITFTPTGVSQSGPIAIQVTKWRKNSSGVYEQISLVRTDIQIIVETSPSNNMPYLSSSIGYDVCGGEEICIDIKSTDAVFIPPPPNPPPAQDSTFINFSRNLKGVSSTITYDSAGQASIDLCWKTSKADISIRPRFVVLRTEDNASPHAHISSRAYNIQVQARVDAELNIDSLGCGAYALNATLNGSYTGLSHSWAIVDSNQNTVWEPEARFGNSRISYRPKDTIQFRKAGTYFIRYTVSSSRNCVTAMYDTIEVKNLFEAHLSPDDTTLCVADELTVNLSFVNAAPFQQVKWFINDTLRTTTSDSFTIKIMDYNVSKKLSVEVLDGSGCIQKDEVLISSHKNHLPVLQDSLEGCQDVLNFSVPSTFKALWSTGEDSALIFPQTTGSYWVRLTDWNGCSDSIFAYAVVHPKPKIALNDSGVCGSSIRLDAGEFAQYFWDDSSGSRYRTINGDGTYSIRVWDKQGCTSFKSFELEFLDLPYVELFNNHSLCCDADLFDLNLLKYGGTYPGGSWFEANSNTQITNGRFDPSFYCDPTQHSVHEVRYEVADTVTGCVKSSTVNLVVLKSPEIQLKEASFCSDKIWFNLANHLLDEPVSVYRKNINWSCVDCNGNRERDILTLQGDPTLNQYYLKIDTFVYKHKNPLVDTVKLKFEYTSDQGCFNSDTVSVYIYKIREAVKIHRVKYTLYSNANDVQWYKNGELIVGATGPVYEVTDSGTYYAKYIQESECEEYASNKITLLLSVPELEDLGISYYPNPTEGLLFIRSVEELEQIELFDTNGKEIELNIERTSEGYEIQWDAADGMYFLKISTADATGYSTILKQRP